MNFQTQPFLIIGGQPKAGTSSVYHWFVGHPAFQPSRLKETRFFLDAGYPLPSSTRYDGSNLAAYAGYFPEPEPGRILLEATPDYLYSATALRIAELLPQARMVFILRDPVERAVSWYKFAAQIGHFAKGYGFEDFVRAQLGQTPEATTPVHMRALDQNRVGKYLPAFQSALGARCLVLDFAELSQDPKGTARKIRRFCGVDESYFDGFEFQARNVTRGVHASRISRAYYLTRAWFIYRFKPGQRLRVALRPLAHWLRNLVSGKAEVARVVIPESLAHLIRQDAGGQ